MPELPEVETVRHSLIERITGRRIEGVRVGEFSGVLGDDDPYGVAARITGRRFVEVRRRAKYLFLDLDDETTIMVHLRMTGQLAVVDHRQPPLRFEHVAIALDDGHDLRFADQRKFGRVLHLLPIDVARIDQRLGPEPLGRRFTSASLSVALRRRPGKLKSVLLDQTLVAGLGNIYVDEALFVSRLHPERAANRLSTSELRRLHRAIRLVLREGIAHRGTTFSSFHDADGAAGGNQHHLRVYGRGDGAPCIRCGHALTRLVVGGRGTHLCPRCQQREPASPSQSDPAGTLPSISSDPESF